MKDSLITQDAQVLVTGASGFVGSRVVAELLRRGFSRVRCGVRRSSDRALLLRAIPDGSAHRCEIVETNLLSRDDCDRAADGVEVVYHMVAGRGKSFPSCFQGSVVTTRNLLEAVIRRGRIKRFVNVSSFAVYSNMTLGRGTVWDETCPIEDNLDDRYDAYAYGKIRQDQLVEAYGQRYAIPHATVRPGIVIGPGKKAIPGFVGLDTFGPFMHIGGRSQLPLTYIDNCAEAIVLAGLVNGIEGEVFNVVDDDLPTSRAFLRGYKSRVRHFRSIRVPYLLAFAFCAAWKWYSKYSNGQLPPVFNPRACAFAWKGHQYSNHKVKSRLGWSCRVPMDEALTRYYTYQKNG